MMAENQDSTFPDLPVTQWWKLRNAFNNNLPRTVSLEYIIGTLKINEVTARNTLRNLALFGLIDKDGKVLERATNWRDDGLYPQVCKEISDQLYPSDLTDLAKASPDRKALVSWFMRKTQIGEKAAHKNAAIFEVIMSGELPSVKPQKEGKQKKPRSKKVVVTPSVATNHPSIPDNSPTTPLTPPSKTLVTETIFRPSIHIDIQLHIAPDAPASQIEEIFAALEKHIYKQRNGE